MLAAALQCPSVSQIPPPGRFPVYSGNGDSTVSDSPESTAGGVPGAAGRGFPGLLSGRASEPKRRGKLGRKLVTPPPMAVLPRERNNLSRGAGASPRAGPVRTN